MSRVTVGKRWPRSLPRGDSQALCDYCGVQWPRSKLVRDGEGLLSCPDEGDGAGEGELNAANSALGAASSSDRVKPVGGRIDTDDGAVTPTQRTTLEDIEL